MTIITNANGERMYMMNYHFFLKVDVMDFQSTYKDGNPLRYFFNKVMPTTEDDPSNKWTKNKPYLKMKDVCTKFSERDYIYLPYCLSLISSYPNGKALNTTIECIIKTLVMFNDNSLLEKLLMHIIYEVPVAPYNSYLTFNLPFMGSKLEIQGSFIDNLPTVECQFSCIFNLSIENIILIHYLTLLEQKILFVSASGDYNSLTCISEAFISLLYPLRWVNTYIPVLTQDLVKYLQSFMPFIMGLDDSLLKLANEYMEVEGVYVVDIKRDCVYSGKNKKKVELKSLWNTLPKLPEESYKFLTLELKEVKKVVEKAKKDKKNPSALMKAEMLIREVFAKSMMILYGDYKNFTSFIDGVPFFNTNSFIQNRKSAYNSFYMELTQTQIYRHFLQVSLTNTEHVHYLFFHELCNDYRFYFSNGEATIDHAVSLIRSKTSPGKSGPLSSRNAESKMFNFNLASARNEKKDNFSNNVCVTEPDNKNQSEAIKYTISSFFNGCLTQLEEKSNKESYQFPDFDKRVFDYRFRLETFNKLFQIPFDSIRCYTKIKKLFKQLHRSLNDVHHVNMIKMTENKDDKKSEKINAYWRLNLQLTGIKVQRKVLLSMLAQDEKMNKFVEQQVKRKQSLISTILTSDQAQLEIYQEQIGDIIKDEMGKLLTSTTLGKENVRDLSYMFKYRYARTIFAKILYQDKFKEHIRHCLDEFSFQELYEIITNALVSCQNDSQYEDIRLMTKSCFYYYKNVETKHKTISVHYICQEIAKKNPFNFWKQSDFWKFYLDAEIDENLVLDTNLSDVEDYYFNQMMLVARIMIDLNLDYKIIMEIMCDNIARNYIRSETLINELKITLEKLKSINGSNLVY